MRDNLFHASTAESIGSRHAETYRRKMRSANAGGANATTAGLNSPISEERRREKEREKNSLVPRPSSSRASRPRRPPPPSRVFVYLAPSGRPRYFILLTGRRRRWRKTGRLLSPRRERGEDGAICRVIIFISLAAV